MIKVQAVLITNLLNVKRERTHVNYFCTLIVSDEQVSGAKVSKKKKLKFTLVKNLNVQA